MGVKRHSLAWKVVVANTLLVVLAVFLVVALEFQRDRKLLESNTRHELSTEVVTGAVLLEGSKVEDLIQGSGGQEREEAARILVSLLNETPSVTRLYVLVRETNGEPRLVIMSGSEAEAKLAPILKASLGYVLARQKPIETPIYKNVGGRWISSFCPIRDQRGRVVAVMGGDLLASDLRLETREKLESTLLIGLGAALVSVVLGLLITRNVTRPLKTMTESAALIASGNLNICLNLQRGDEIGELGDSFNLMVERLAIANQERERLHAEVLKNEKLEQEIKLAAQIQQSFLPVSFPWSPHYRANARSVPADVVGGDFYDFVELSENQIGIVIGDVAGRGIAAAVYMARVISDFRAVALRTASPREALERLNHLLYSRSTRGIFVTMTYLVLDSSTGELKYSSGGHLPALLRRGSTGSVEVLDEDSGFPLGITSRANLGERVLNLQPEDELLLVTDGVVEGLCACHDVFSFDKLVGIFENRLAHENGVVDAVFEEIARISSAEVQQDDMTVLTLAWKIERKLAATL